MTCVFGHLHLAPRSRRGPGISLPNPLIVKPLRWRWHHPRCCDSCVPRWTRSPVCGAWCFFVEATRSRVYPPKKCVVKHQEKIKVCFFGGCWQGNEFTFSKTRKTRMNDTNLHYNLLIHVSCSLRTSYLPVRVRFGRGQILTCPKNKIPHFQGFKRNEVHYSSWQTLGSKFMNLRVTRLKIHMKICNCIFKPLMPVPSHIAYAVSVFSLWTHLN